MNSRMIFAAAALVASLGVFPVLAQAQDVEVRHEKVGFDDLDLTRTAGARVMLQRIAAASGRVCGPVESARDLAMFAERRRCMTTAAKDAVDELQNPIVTALYEGRATAPAYRLAANATAASVR